MNIVRSKKGCRFPKRKNTSSDIVVKQSGVVYEIPGKYVYLKTGKIKTIVSSIMEPTIVNLEKLNKLGVNVTKENGGVR